MGITKTQLKQKIKRSLGGPTVKVELHDDQMNDSISRARQMHMKWAFGNASQEVFFTKMISSGQMEYEMPSGVLDVIDMNDDTGNLGKATQLFTVQNQMVMTGMLQNLSMGGFSLVNYHIGLDYLDTLNMYTVSSFNGRYHYYNNTLMLSPVPSASPNGDTTSTNYMLIRSAMKEGYDILDTTENNEYVESIYLDPGFEEYCIALCKIQLGYVRRKFSNFTSIGNTGIQLDGDQLLQEGREDKERLEEQLRDNEVGEGGEISVG